MDCSNTQASSSLPALLPAALPNAVRDVGVSTQEKNHLRALGFSPWLWREGQVEPPSWQKNRRVVLLREFGSRSGRKDMLNRLSLTQFTTYTLPKDIFTDWNETLFVFVADKYIFYIFILSDNFDYTSITMRVSTLLISTAQGKNTKHKT